MNATLLPSPNHDAVSDEPELATPPTLTEMPPPGRGAGRPSTCTRDRVHAVCAFIRLTGLSDTAAGALAGVKRSTLSRWKLEDEEVELELGQARAQYLIPRLEKIGQTIRRDGQLDWRAQAWLVKFALAGADGMPSGGRKVREVEMAEEGVGNGGVGDAGMGEAGPERGDGAEARNVAIRPEITRSPRKEGRGICGNELSESERMGKGHAAPSDFAGSEVMPAACAETGGERGGVSNVAIRPEIGRASAGGVAQAADARVEAGAAAMGKVAIRPEIGGACGDGGPSSSLRFACGSVGRMPTVADRMSNGDSAAGAHSVCTA